MVGRRRGEEERTGEGRGGGGAGGVLNTCLFIVQLIKNGPVPVHWNPPQASEGRFQASSVAIFIQPQVEEKDCEARPPHLPPSPTKKEAAIFSISLALDALDPEYYEPVHWGHVFLVNGTLLPVLLPSSRRCPGVTTFLLPPPLPTPGSDQG